MVRSKQENIERLHVSLMQFKRVIAREMQGHFDGLTPTPVQIELLHKLMKGSYRSKDLAHITGASPSAITQQINQLVDLGLVSKQVDQDDKRAQELSLTPKGQELIKSSQQKLTKSLHNITSSLSEVELQKFVELLEKMTKKD